MKMNVKICKLAAVIVIEVCAAGIAVSCARSVDTGVMSHHCNEASH